MNTDTPHLSRPKLLLFDVGDVLVCDSTSAIFVYRCLYDALGEHHWGTPQDLVNEREKLINSGKAKDLWKVVELLLPDSIELDEFRQHTRAEMYNDWGYHSPAVPLMAEVLHKLSKSFRLGLLANQPETIEDVLRERELWDLFEIQGISDIVKMHKPQENFFLWAINEAHLPPNEIMMIGDRVDNDIVPAKKLGMSGCWINFPPEMRPWEPYDEFTRAFKPCKNLVCVPQPIDPKDEQYLPDITVVSPRDLLNKLCALE
ncbi:HAD family hydrolase [Candidatus Sumerlaeota bacterium]|nr:HAD family hydrolase [Candidatus Sumerlaeales bacterium]NLD61946.1 HAD family hydrolase [Candidatus Sumerlaeota bacterium]